MMCCEVVALVHVCVGWCARWLWCCVLHAKTVSCATKTDNENFDTVVCIGGYLVYYIIIINIICYFGYNLQFAISYCSLDSLSWVRMIVKSAKWVL